MKTLLGQLAIAVVLAAAGGLCWKEAQVERRLADAHADLLVLQQEAPIREYDDIESSAGLAQRVPGLSAGVAADVREHRAAAEYWQARYDALAPSRDATGATTEEDPAVLLTAANAAFRTTERDASGRQALVQGLDAVLKSYVEVLKKEPALVDAAYNYEYVARRRDTVAKSKPSSSAAQKSSDQTRRVVTNAPTGDLPDGPTLHGRPGAPPPNTDMKQFKMHIPVRPDERRGGSDEGAGRAKIRRG
jgi:hypothetical protein